MIVVKKAYANLTANVTSSVTTSDTYTDNLIKSVNIIKNNIDSNNEIIIHNINSQVVRGREGKGAYI